MKQTDILKVGTQIIEVSPHIRPTCGDNIAKLIKHPGVEFGFVSSANEHRVMCRFWNEGEPALRTVSTSEGCQRHQLELYDKFPQAFVDALIEIFRAEPEEYGWYEGIEDDNE